MSEDKDTAQPTPPSGEPQDAGADQPPPAARRELSVKDEEAEDGDDVKGGGLVWLGDCG